MMTIDKIIMPDDPNDVLVRKVDRVIEKLNCGDYLPRQLSNEISVYFMSRTERIVICENVAHVFSNYFSYDQYLESVGH